MKKILALVLCLALVAALFVGCSDNKPETGKNTEAGNKAATTIKVGLICIGDENDQGYTYNFIRGKDAATEALKAKGINVEWVVKWNIPEGDIPWIFPRSDCPQRPRLPTCSSPPMLEL